MSTRHRLNRLEHAADRLPTPEPTPEERAALLDDWAVVWHEFSRICWFSDALDDFEAEHRVLFAREHTPEEAAEIARAEEKWLRECKYRDVVTEAFAAWIEAADEALERGGPPSTVPSPAEVFPVGRPWNQLPFRITGLAGVLAFEMRDGEGGWRTEDPYALALYPLATYLFLADALAFALPREWLGPAVAAHFKPNPVHPDPTAP